MRLLSTVSRMLCYLLIGGSSISCLSSPRGEQKADALPAKTLDKTLLFDGVSLGKWEAINFGPQGAVSVVDSAICMEMGDGCTGIAWKGEVPRTDYTLSLEAMRMEGNDFFGSITFPVGEDHCTLVVGGWGGTTVGLSNIDDEDASENETSRFMIFKKHRWYPITLTVADQKIVATIDRDTVVDFPYAGRRISIRPDISLTTPLGIFTWCTTSKIKNIRLQAHSHQP